MKKMWKKNNYGFSIVYLLIVVFFAVALVVMGAPFFLRAKAGVAKRACISNLVVLDDAVNQWVERKNIAKRTAIVGNEAKIYKYLASDEINCPSGGIYTFGRVGIDPQVRCSKADELAHELP